MQSLTPNRSAIRALTDQDLLTITAQLYDISVRLAETTITTTPLFEALIDEIEQRELLGRLGAEYARMSTTASRVCPKG